MTKCIVQNKLRIAMQSKGRLSQVSMNFLTSLGLKFSLKGRKLINPCENLNLDLLFLRSDDIPEYVSRGVVDFGIVGENVLYEKKVKVKKIKVLGFGKCRIVIAIPNQSEIKKISDLNGLRIATSYPEILRSFLEKNKIKASIISMKGSCEIAPSLDLADAICDIVQSGNTLKEHDLKVFVDIVDSEACLIESPINCSSKLDFLTLIK